MKRVSILRRGGAVGLASALLAAATAFVVLGPAATPARADTDEPTLFDQRNSSDPEIQQCSDQGSGWAGLCMFTSNDLTSSGPWYYPMDKTYLYTLDTGLDPSVPGNWVDRGAIFNESDLVVPMGGTAAPVGQPGPFVPAGAKHLWAPTHTFFQGMHYLLVPDVTHVSDGPAPNVHTSSRIAIATSTSLFGPYAFQKTYNISVGAGAVSDYASDPAIFFRPLQPRQTTPTPYLVWADGDGDNCGGLSIAALNSNDITTLASTPQTITISGLAEAFGTSGPGCTTRPYLEGAALYWFSNGETGAGGNPFDGAYYLVFAVKPQGGTHGMSQEVIAYATASTLTSPFNFTYRGVIMEASQTEWTNQASIQKYGDHYIFAYHDGPQTTGNPAARKVRGACLTFSGGKINPVQRTLDGFARCMAVQGTVALRSRGNGKVVVAPPSGGTLSATNPNIGLWERFDIEPRNGGRFALRAHSNGKYVTINDTQDILRANVTDPNAAGEFALQFNGNGSVSIRNPFGGLVEPAGPSSDLVRSDIPFFNPHHGTEFDVVPLNGAFGLRTAFEERRFVTAPNESQSPLVASGGSGTTVAVAEAFGFSFETNGFGRARLQWAAPLPFVCAASPTSPLIPNKLVVEDCVTFTLLWNTDGTFSLQSAVTGGFVAAPPTWFGGPLIADRTVIGTWERFDLVSFGSGLVW